MKRKSRLEMKGIQELRRRNLAGQEGTTEERLAGTKFLFHAKKDAMKDEGSHHKGAAAANGELTIETKASSITSVSSCTWRKSSTFIDVCEKKLTPINLCEGPCGPPASPRRRMRRRNICASFFPPVKTFQGGQTLPG